LNGKAKKGFGREGKKIMDHLSETAATKSYLGEGIWRRTKTGGRERWWGVKKRRLPL